MTRLIDVEEMFADSAFSSASISPDGTRIAYLAPKDGRTQVWVRGLGDTHDEAVCVTHDSRRGVKRYQWTDDPRWMTYLQDTDGNEDWHLYRIDLEHPESSPVDLTPMKPGGRVVSAELIKDDPAGLLVSMNARPMFIDTFRVDLATEERTLVFENDSVLGGMLFGPHLEPFWFGLTPDGTWEICQVDPDTGQRRRFYEVAGAELPLGPTPVTVTPDGKGVLLPAYLDDDDLKLIRVDAITGEDAVVAALPGRSLCTVGSLGGGPPTTYTSAQTGEVIAARFAGGRSTIVVVDPAYTELFNDLAGLCDGELWQLSCDDDEKTYVATFAHDRDPEQTYVFDRATGTGELLFRGRPDLDPADLAPMVPVSITARDGLPLEAFLTLPVGVDPVNLPLVLHVHGGPWAHDVWEYDRETLLLANRGYAVLKPNFRGSSGYGKKHITAAVGELAGAMHDDLIDCVDWAIEQGIADPKRIGVYGGSYGGYAALVSVTFTPDRFAAAVDFCGISNLVGFMESLPDFVKPTMVNNWLLYAGDPSIPEQRADLLARSPITKVAEIVTPLLVVQGAQDPRVVQEEADNIVAALRERNVPVDYILAEDEGHGFQNPENLVLMWHGIEQHYAKHLGGRAGIPREVPLDDRRLGAFTDDAPWQVVPDALTWLPQAQAERTRVPARAARLTRPRALPGWRAARVAATVLRQLAPWFLIEKRRDNGEAKLAARLRVALERLGPTYVKLGQLISSGRDLIPDAYIDELVKLQDDVAPIPFHTVRSVVEADLGRPLDHVFASFDQTRLASASIAQVHAATLLDGSTVVVKVQRPGIRDIVAKDLRVLAWLSRRVSKPGKSAAMANPLGYVELLAETITEEIDFRLEAENLLDVARAIRRGGQRNLVCPRPHPELVTQRVFVMERMVGRRVDDFVDQPLAHADAQVLLRSMVISFIEGALVYGVFHGDLHAGNTMLTPDGRAALFDFGITGRLAAADREAVLRLLLGALTKDHRTQIKALAELGMVPVGTDMTTLMAELGVDPDTGRTTSSAGGINDFSALIKTLLRHDAKMSKELMLIVKGVLYLDGAITTLADDLDVNDEITYVVTYFLAKHTRLLQKLLSVAGQVLRDVDPSRGLSDILGILDPEAGGRMTFRQLRAKQAEMQAKMVADVQTAAKHKSS